MADYFWMGPKRRRSTMALTAKIRPGVAMINCSRWEELRSCVLFHAEMAASIGAPTIFRLLNDPNVIIREELRSSGGDLSQIKPLPQVIGVCARKNKGVPSSGRLRNMLRMSHDTPTPGNRGGNAEDEVAAKQQWEGFGTSIPVLQTILT